MFLCFTDPGANLDEYARKWRNPDMQPNHIRGLDQARRCCIRATALMVGLVGCVPLALSQPVYLSCITESPKEYVGLSWQVMFDDAKKVVQLGNGMETRNVVINDLRIHFMFDKELEFSIDRLNGHFNVGTREVPAASRGKCTVAKERQF
jgi:hypothetical protein